VDIVQKVLDRLPTSEKTTIVISRDHDGKMRVTSGRWDGEKVILKDQVLEVRNVDSRAPCGAQGAKARRVGPADRADYSP
jgi:hypothetical protein